MTGEEDKEMEEKDEEMDKNDEKYHIFSIYDDFIS